MQETLIPIVICTLSTVTKGLLKGLEELEIRKKSEWRSFKLQHYEDRLEYREESLRLEETCCHSNSSEKQSVNDGMKNSPRS